MFATKKVKSDTYIIEFCVIIMAESQYMYSVMQNRKHNSYRIFLKISRRLMI